MVLQDGCVRHIYPGFFSWFRERVGGVAGDDAFQVGD